MGLFDRIKKAIDIGGVTLRLDRPTKVAPFDGIVQGKLRIWTKEPRRLNKLTVEIVALDYRRHRRADGETGWSEYLDTTLARLVVAKDRDLAAGERDECTYEIRFQPIAKATPGQTIKDVLFKGLVGIKAEHRVRATIYVEGAALHWIKEQELFF